MEQPVPSHNMAGKKKSTRKKVRLSNIYRRSLFYSVCLFAVFEFMLILVQVKSYINFWLLFVIGFFVVIFELLYSRVNEYMTPFSVKVKHWRKRIWNESFLYHLVLPSLFYISGALFIFYNRVRVLDQVAVLIVTIGFLILFYNISCTYRKIYSISRSTKYIFDFMNIIVFYFYTDIFVNSIFYHGWPRWMIYIGTSAISFILVAMMVVMFDQLKVKILLYSLFTALLVGIGSFVVMQIPLLNIATLSLLITVGYYLADVFWHHKLEGTYDSDTMSQYIIFAIMVIILILYI